MVNNAEQGHNSIIESFRALSGKEELLAKVIDFFPYLIQVYAPDGTSVLVNKALLDEYHLAGPEFIVWKYNVLKDPSVIATGKYDLIKRAFRGETVFVQDIRVPIEDITERYGIHDLDILAAYQDITIFPIFDDQKQVIYVAALLINRRVYRGKDEVEKAKEHIENHWMEPFSISETAKAACLSKAHFTRLFRKHTGMTPHEYYINYKINKLKEKLLDNNLSVAQAFAACNLDYNGHSAKVFRDKTGVSPSAYRKMSAKKNWGLSMEEQVKETRTNLDELFRLAVERQELLVKVIEFFPYPIQIFSGDGTARIVNKAALDIIGIKSMESHVGKYNVFRDPIVSALGATEKVREVLRGKTVYLTDFNAPYQDMVRYFDVKDRDIQTISADITCFPVIRSDKGVECFAAVFFIKKIYKGKEEIGWGRQYIEAHWQEPFDADATARAACLSKAHFTKLFKKHTGVTPYEYYINYKIIKLKEKLLDVNLTVKQAFAYCNMDYNGHSARMFKQKVGLSPSAYRKMSGSSE